MIEGFYGRSWSWESRETYADFLMSNGFDFYIYAPKDDTYLRRRWRDSWPDNQMKRLMHLAAVYTDSEVSWGIGLSPYEIHLSYDGEAKQALRQKMEAINRLDPDILCVLLDDMKGDVPGLAETQAEVFNQIADLSTARRFILCPTYYSFDPILEKVFGTMPEGYWDTLGRLIDPAVDFFWTGPQVCSIEYPEAHLTAVTDQLGRKPFIWDNYPVNDSEKRSKHLYLRPSENRPHRLSEQSAGHAVNPMNQAWLSQIPIWTLGNSYHAKTGYDPQKTLINAVETLCGTELGNRILENLPVLQDQGLDSIGEDQKWAMTQEYSRIQSPFAKEIIEWLQGRYAFDPACLTE